MKLQIRNCVTYLTKFEIDFTIQILEYTFPIVLNIDSYNFNFHVKLILFAFNSVILNANSTCKCI